MSDLKAKEATAQDPHTWLVFESRTQKPSVVDGAHVVNMLHCSRQTGVYSGFAAGGKQALFILESLAIRKANLLLRHIQSNCINPAQ